MASEMFIFDDTNYYPDEISGSNFFNDPLSDSSIDSFLQEISDDHNNKNNKTQDITPQILPEEVQSLDQITHALFSDSPPSHQLNTLSLQQQQSHFSTLENVYIDNYCDIPEVKTEEFHLGFDYSNPSQSSNSNSCFYGGGESDENMLKFMQRSYSSNCFEGKKGNFLLQQQQPRFDSLLEVHNFHPEDETSQIRRVCSTGDLPVGVNKQTCTQQTICSSSPLSGEGSNFIEEANFKVGKYSAEERKERIDRYKAKRTQRNFNKTIKYACRKTLADNRPRIRGRFARNDETGEIPKPTSFNPTYDDDDDDDLWVDNMQDENERVLGRGGGRRFMSNFGATQFQYCGY